MRLWCLLACLFLFNVEAKRKTKLKQKTSKVTKDSDPSDLFLPDNSSVQSLQHDTFNATLLKSERTWLVLFYLSWCGHCMKFAPTYEQLGVEMSEWKEVVGIAAINCANTKNLVFCQGVTSFPKVKILPAHSTNITAQMLSTKGRSIDSLKQQVAGSIYKQKSHHLLTPVSSTRDYPSSCVYLCGNVNMSALVILDVMKYESVCTRILTEGLCPEKSNDTVTLYRISGSGQLEASGSENITSEAVSHVLKLHDIKLIHTSLATKLLTTVHPNKSSKYTAQSLQNMEAVYWGDLYYALSYSLQKEVGLVVQFTEESLNCLKVFINVLAQYFPFDELMTPVLNRISENLDSVSIPYTGSQWNSLLTDCGFSETLDGRNELVRCLGSSPQFRGYPCTLWTLFHTLSVSGALQKPLNGAGEVLLAMKGYIATYFGCDDCAHNFAKMAAKLDTLDLSKSKEMVLWMWTAHNSANSRLSGDASEDPYYHKLQYPSARSCPSCRSSKGLWMEDNVYLYLVRIYTDIRKSAEPISNESSRFYDDVRTDLFNTGYEEEGLGGFLWSGVGLTSTDMRLCLWMYTLCAVIILVLCYLLLVRRRLYLRN